MISTAQLLKAGEMIEALSYTFLRTCVYPSTVMPGSGTLHMVSLRQVHFWDPLSIFWQAGQGAKAPRYRESEGKNDFFPLDSSSHPSFGLHAVGRLGKSPLSSSWAHCIVGSTPSTFMRQYPDIWQHKTNHPYPALKYSYLSWKILKGIWLHWDKNHSGYLIHSKWIKLATNEL